MPLVRFSVSADPELLDALADCLLSAGAGALEEGPSCLIAYADSTELVQSLQQAVVEFTARVAELAPGLTVAEPELSEVEVDWQAAWLEHLVPVPVTATFTVRPTHAPDAPAGERTIWIEPYPAFGEGAHASTRLAARALERHAQSRQGGRLLDVGTGTGVLSFLALSSGLESALAIDIDPSAIEAATKNAARNGLTERCEVSSVALSEVSGHFEIVVANMLVPTLLELAPALVARLSPGGVLVLSGLLLEDATALAETFGSLGTREVTRHSEGDWCCLELAID